MIFQLFYVEMKHLNLHSMHWQMLSAAIANSRCFPVGLAIVCVDLNVALSSSVTSNLHISRVTTQQRYRFKTKPQKKTSSRKGMTKSSPRQKDSKCRPTHNQFHVDLIDCSGWAIPFTLEGGECGAAVCSRMRRISVIYFMESTAMAQGIYATEILFIQAYFTTVLMNRRRCWCRNAEFLSSDRNRQWIPAQYSVRRSMSVEDE